MKYEIAKGIGLTTIPTTKFKNSKIIINFTFRAHHETMPSWLCWLNFLKTVPQSMTVNYLCPVNFQKCMVQVLV